MYIASHMNYENHLQEILCNFLYVNKLGIGGDDLKTQFLHNWMVTMYMAMLQWFKNSIFAQLNGHNVHGHVTVYEAITFHKAGDIL